MPVPLGSWYQAASVGCFTEESVLHSVNLVPQRVLWLPGL